MFEFNVVLVIWNRGVKELVVSGRFYGCRRYMVWMFVDESFKGGEGVLKLDVVGFKRGVV